MLGLRPEEGLRAKGLHSYLGDVPWGLGREGLVRADSTSVWPRLVTELWAGEEKWVHCTSRWTGIEGAHAASHMGLTVSPWIDCPSLLKIKQSPKQSTAVSLTDLGVSGL